MHYRYASLPSSTSAWLTTQAGGALSGLDESKLDLAATAACPSTACALQRGVDSCEKLGGCPEHQM